MLRRAAFQSLLVPAFCLAASVGPAAAQPSAIQYAYDELGRLVAVVDQQGNAAFYAYDLVGNLLSIQRVDAATLSGPVAITAVVPEQGKTGTAVSILGKGFSAAAGQNLVAFHGATASVAQAAANRLIAIVPPGATTGPITVAAPLGSASSPRPFRIIGTIEVAPAAVTLGAGQTQQFIATAGGVAMTGATWAVGGIVGGDADVGTLSPQGLYTAPATNPAARTVTITATSPDDPSAAGTAVITLRAPIPAFLAAASVGVQGAPDGGGLSIVAGPVGVSPPVRDTFSSPAQLSVQREPLITSLSPAGAVRGATNLAFIATGTGLAGATSLEFLRNNVPDTAISVADLTAAPDGTRATARISITSTAALGDRVVRVRTPASTTTAVGTGGNVFTVQ